MINNEDLNEIYRNSERFDEMIKKIDELIDEEFINLGKEIIEDKKIIIFEEIRKLFDDDEDNF